MVTFLRKKVCKLLLLTGSALLVVIGYINLNRTHLRHSITQHVDVDEWNVLEGWTPELDGSKSSCKDILKRMERNLTGDYFTLGLAAIIKLVDFNSSVSEYHSEMRNNLTALKDLFQSCDVVHALSSIDGADRMDLDRFTSFLSASEFDTMREVGVSSLSLAAPELKSEGIRSVIPQIMLAARTSGIHLTGVVSQEGALAKTREQAQHIKVLDISQGKRVGVISYCVASECEEKTKHPTYRPAFYAPVSPYDIQLLRVKGAGLVIVSVNWGLSSHDSFKQYKEVVNHQLARSGANIIVGQHPMGKHSHSLYGNSLAINSAGVMFGRNSGAKSTRYPDTEGTDSFLFYRIHYGRLGGMKFEYMLLDKKNLRNRMQWVEVCSNQDVYCIECVTYV